MLRQVFATFVILVIAFSQANERAGVSQINCILLWNEHIKWFDLFNSNTRALRTLAIAKALRERVLLSQGSITFLTQNEGGTCLDCLVIAVMELSILTSNGNTDLLSWMTASVFVSRSVVKWSFRNIVLLSKHIVIEYWSISYVIEKTNCVLQ